MKMKRLYLTIIAVIASAGLLHAQNDVQKAAAEAAAALLEAPAQEEEVKKPNYWKQSATLDLGFNQTGLFSWAKGGYNTLSLNTGILAQANYAKELTSWTNKLNMKYGFLWSEDKKNLLQKSNDLIDFKSRLTYKAAKDSKWNFSASFDFLSQFTRSYDSYKQDENTGKWDGRLKSGFLSPATAEFGLGMEWIPSSWLKVNIAPLTGSFKICTIEDLRQRYGMKLKEEGLDGSIGDNYRSSLFQLGAKLTMDFKARINDNFSYDTTLSLFTDYLSDPFNSNRVNWDNRISFHVAKYFKISLDTWLIYDPLVTIEGSRKVQFKEYFAISFTYTFAK